ncbi:Caleosin-domain-containing protein [Trametes versicolor FP-101664 SS1]|uniref:Caleosin-domain-containing protein n=1 Tax=Trametes versicolor (strain FP-101664) TaxID=717944 RepID=UPI000462339C|nr:Caleosin-domain-containing protein [Trametes versicolor FP-101664 SS1]EIW63435.1 Caleosin-domain-containing protein [Trametes versicolor FP-101664 SS1]
MADQKANVVVQTAVPEVRVTITRPPFNPVPAVRKHLPNAGTPRANRAPTTSAPDGSPEWTEEHAHQTVLQQHCAFFDADGDGVIWPLDTFRGFHALGFGVLLSALAVLVIHLNFSYPTCPGLLPDPFFRLFLDNVHRAKHGSDSGTYDGEGRFVPQKFEDFFNKYSNGKDGLTLSDLWEALKGQRVIMDPIGWFGAFFEWIATYILLWPEDGVMKREDVRRVFDGSIFAEIASKRAGKAAKSKAA